MEFKMRKEEEGKEKGTEEYFPWIDTVKGIGLFLVVLGHLWYGSNQPAINTAIYSFHMPLFFILSGFVTRSTDRECTRKYIGKQFFRLLLPAYGFLALSMPLYFMQLDGESLWTIVKRICFWDGLVPYNAPCWFFIVLFETKVIERLLNISQKTKKKEGVIMFLFFLIGYIIYSFDIFLPFGLDRCIVALGFLSFGMVVRSRIKEKRHMVLGEKFALFILWFMSGIVLNTKVSMYRFDFGNYWQFVLSGISGSLLFVDLCRFVDKRSNYFRQWGCNTIFVVGTHYMLVSLFDGISGKINIQNTWIYNIIAIFYAIGIIIVYQPLCTFINNKIPLMNGKSK